jgi:hypothetical protein
MDSWKVPVLLLPMSLGIGGAETQVVSLAKHLKKRGWSVLVASAGGSWWPHWNKRASSTISRPSTPALL